MITFVQGDCLDVLRGMPDDTIDLVFGSPPYSDARSYGELNFSLKGDLWVGWAAERFLECYRACKGLTAWVVAGRTRNFRWDATPALLTAFLHDRGVRLRNPPIFHRVGIPGSGGPDWLRSDYEWIICASKGKLPWSDNTACGHEPKFPPGGKPSHRMTFTDERVNKRSSRTYNPPKKANPGNVISLHGGGGHLGDKLAHENEAPFPEKLAEFFIKSFCPPDGLVVDPFSGSGTTCAVADRLGRDSLGIDIRQSQIELGQRRCKDVVRTGL